MSDEVRQLIDELRKEDTVSLPKQLNASLRPYLTRGFAWMYRNMRLGFGSILADDIGLGKTIQAAVGNIPFRSFSFHFCLSRRQPGFEKIQPRYLTDYLRRITLRQRKTEKAGMDRHVYRRSTKYQELRHGTKQSRTQYSGRHTHRTERHSAGKPADGILEHHRVCQQRLFGHFEGFQRDKCCSTV